MRKPKVGDVVFVNQFSRCYTMSIVLEIEAKKWYHNGKKFSKTKIGVCDYEKKDDTIITTQIFNSNKDFYERCVYELPIGSELTGRQRNG